MEAAHALFGPSSAHKWMRCAGALAMEEDQPDSVTEYSDEGTAAHELAKWCLDSGKDAAAFKGRVIEIVNGRYYPAGGAPLPPLAKGHKTHIRRKFKVDDGMVEAVQRYVDSVRQYADGKDLRVEQRLDISEYIGAADQFGTGDAIVLDHVAGEIQVHDLKFGKGVEVDAFENEQGMLYALGAFWMFSMLGDFERVRIVIHQPRIRENPSEWDVSVTDLLAFAGRVKAAAEVAQYAFELKRTNPEKFVKGYLEPGNKQCKFCKAKAICPKRAAEVAKTVLDEFDDLTATELAPIAKAIAAAPLPPVPTEIDALATLYGKVEAIEDWCRAVAATFEAKLLDGATHPAWKVVAGKKGNRAWRDEDEAEKTLKSFRLKQEQMYSFKLITPTAAEKLLKEQPGRWKKLTALVTQADGKPTIAPATDKRPALEIKPVIDEFDDLTGGADAPTTKAA